MPIVALLNLVVHPVLSKDASVHKESNHTNVMRATTCATQGLGMRYFLKGVAAIKCYDMISTSGATLEPSRLYAQHIGNMQVHTICRPKHTNYSKTTTNTKCRGPHLHLKPSCYTQMLFSCLFSNHAMIHTPSSQHYRNNKASPHSFLNTSPHSSHASHSLTHPALSRAITLRSKPLLTRSSCSTRSVHQIMSSRKKHTPLLDIQYSTPSFSSYSAS